MLDAAWIEESKADLGYGIPLGSQYRSSPRIRYAKGFRLYLEHLYPILGKPVA
ncbi:hypothetical protein [Candidatus Pelagisphaera phototrophica]|uniref:hypothetical protein n=1 Tax=Candidatus Pelagisphaera phototrophica TaxID=2684113 RepID=UPI0024B79A66|nr:hypothetical protein [Candidatus Pelagisphaera phototrophica]QXD31329.1 hypothetical protein GA004_13475 [Candidatus Pelagisphaera phototrophica]